MSEPSNAPGCLGDYRILREVGRGEMGIVYEAEAISIRRRVALKVLPIALCRDAVFLQAFRAEAVTAARMHHANIVPIFAVGCERGVHYYVMELVTGQSLTHLIRKLRLRTESSPERQPVNSQMVAQLVIQAAEGLESAHQLGVVHRDIEPGNLLVDEAGKLWITDFGLAQLSDFAPLKMAGGALGNLAYMSPELALGEGPVDHRADIYSLGAVLYELLTLEPPISGGDRQEILRQIADKEPRPPRELNKTILPDLEAIILMAMAKDPGQRYQTSQELAADLRHFLENKPIKAKRPTVLKGSVN